MEKIMLRYTEDHEWIKLEGDTGTVGISPHAIEQLGDIVFIELPEVGASVNKGAAAAVFESVKAASEIYSPASGKIIDVNSGMLEDLTAITAENAMDNWIFKIKINDETDLDGLMDEEKYNAMIS
jgi:glycine cleavage system H protein